MRYCVQLLSFCGILPVPPLPPLAVDCHEETLVFLKHMLHMPGIFPQSHLAPHKSTGMKIFLFPFYSGGNWVSVSLRNLPQLWIIESKLKREPSVSKPRSLQSCSKSAKEQPDSLPQTLCQASVLRENELPANQSWIQLLFYRDVVSW